MRKRITFTISMTAASLQLLACGADDGDPLRGRGESRGAGGEPPAATGEQPAAGDPALCKGREYVGYGSSKLTDRRVVAKLGVNRGRVKPFGALKTEFERVLGNKPASLATARRHVRGCTAALVRGGHGERGRAEDGLRHRVRRMPHVRRERSEARAGADRGQRTGGVRRDGAQVLEQDAGAAGDRGLRRRGDDGRGE